MSTRDVMTLEQEGIIGTMEKPPKAGRKMKRSKARSSGVMPYLMVLPALVMLGIFVIWPAVYAGFLSFHDWSFYKDPAFVGFRNYANVLKDPLFWAAVRRGFIFVAMTVPVMLVLAFLFSSLVVSVSRRFASVLKVSIYIPTIISAVIASIIFVLIYDYSGGLLNALLGVFGVDPVAWIGDPRWALFAIAVPAIWLGMGLTSLIMVAGMIDIPQEFYEAASMEGANWWQKTFYITLPQMKNILLYLLITGFVSAIQQYELPLVMTGGGPLDSTTTPNLFIFNHFRNDMNVGYSIAAALLLFVVLGSISALVFKFVNSERLVD
ncbi:sugar ABC transporter permease [Actinomycetaceae bacterium MB13-C1-2]|nr:sugar ABC transporter permease [Actinomycetaceae bacterium MB13-C1-2]